MRRCFNCNRFFEPIYNTAWEKCPNCGADGA